jgi:hypothetical protein
MTANLFKLPMKEGSESIGLILSKVMLVVYSISIFKLLLVNKGGTYLYSVECIKMFLEY